MSNAELLAAIVAVIVLLLIEGALIALAVAHWRTGRYSALTLWTTRVAVVGCLFVSAAGIYEAVWEITTQGYPWTLGGQPLGTYDEPTKLGVSLVAVGAAWSLAASIVAFFRPRVAAVLFFLGGLEGFAGTLRSWLFDETFPPGNVLVAALMVFVPIIIVGLLLWSWSGPILPRWPRGRSPRRPAMVGP